MVTVKHNTTPEPTVGLLLLTPRGLGGRGFFILITTWLKFLGHYLISIYSNPRNLYISGKKRFCPLTFYIRIMTTSYTENMKNLRKLKNGGKLLQFLICKLLASKKLFRYGICTIKITLYNSITLINSNIMYFVNFILFWKIM